MAESDSIFERLESTEANAIPFSLTPYCSLYCTKISKFFIISISVNAVHYVLDTSLYETISFRWTTQSLSEIMLPWTVCCEKNGSISSTLPRRLRLLAAMFYSFRSQSWGTCLWGVIMQLLFFYIYCNSVRVQDIVCKKSTVTPWLKNIRVAIIPYIWTYFWSPCNPVKNINSHSVVLFQK